VHGGDNLQMWRIAVNILNKQSWTADKGLSSSLGLGMGLTTPHHKNKLVTKIHRKPQAWTDSFDKGPKRKKYIKISVTESQGSYELKKHKSWLNEGCSILLDQRK
jgi:hypothetical protein